jgi:beta-mannanase
MSTLAIGVHASRPHLLEVFEESAETSADIVAVHKHWGNENAFPTAYAEMVRARGATLMVFWNPMDYRKGAEGQTRFYFDEILSGKWDEYIDEFAAASADFGGPVIIAPLEEANGYWTFWSGYEERYGTIAEYKAVFRYLRERFRDVPNVRFAWVMNHVSVPQVPENAISLYYPGDDVVDLIGINAFNFGTPWLSFGELVERPLREVAPYGKPIYITSTASAEGDEKDQWIRDFFASPYFRAGTLKGFIWFNEDKERNWLITSDPSAARAFRAGVAQWREDS